MTAPPGLIPHHSGLISPYNYIALHLSCFNSCFRSFLDPLVKVGLSHRQVSVRQSHGQFAGRKGLGERDTIRDRGREWFH